MALSKGPERQDLYEKDFPFDFVRCDFTTVDRIQLATLSSRKRFGNRHFQWIGAGRQLGKCRKHKHNRHCGNYRNDKHHRSVRDFRYLRDVQT
jgi:hypothetical protein